MKKLIIAIFCVSLVSIVACSDENSNNNGNDNSLNQCVDNRKEARILDCCFLWKYAADQTGESCDRSMKDKSCGIIIGDTINCPDPCLVAVMIDMEDDLINHLIYSVQGNSNSKVIDRLLDSASVSGYISMPLGIQIEDSLLLTQLRYDYVPSGRFPIYTEGDSIIIKVNY